MYKIIYDFILTKKIKYIRIIIYDFILTHVIIYDFVHESYTILYMNDHSRILLNCQRSRLNLTLYIYIYIKREKERERERERERGYHRVSKLVALHASSTRHEPAARVPSTMTFHTLRAQPAMKSRLVYHLPCMTFHTLRAELVLYLYTVGVALVETRLFYVGSTIFCINDQFYYLHIAPRAGPDILDAHGERLNECPLILQTKFFKGVQNIIKLISSSPCQILN